MAPEGISPWPVLLADLALVASCIAFLLYVLRAVFSWQPLSDYGRLALLVAFGALSLMFGLQAHSPALLYFFILLAVFLALEFLFSMSALGWFVALVGAVLLYHQRLFPLPVASATTAPLGSYWLALRDIAMPTGCAFLTLGVAAAVLLAPRNPRPGSGLSAPNDLFDVAIVVSKTAIPFLFFGTFASGMAVWLSHGASRQILWLLGTGILLLVSAIPWLFGLDKRRLAGGERRWMLALNALGLLAYGAGAWL